jgi:putative membrane protein insertion efficiency factor
MRQIAVALIRLYQLVLSPLIGDVCRFEPSCSRYAIAVIERFGILRGSLLAMKRILRCHPWNPGGYDPPPLPHTHSNRSEAPLLSTIAGGSK